MPNLFYDRVERSNDAVTALERDAAETPELAAERALWPRWLPSDLVNLASICAAARICWSRCVPRMHAERLEGLWPLLRDKLP